MGFFKGKPKDKDKDEKPQTGTGRNTRRSVRTIAPGGRPPAPPAAAPGPEVEEPVSPPQQKAPGPQAPQRPGTAAQRPTAPQQPPQQRQGAVPPSGPRPQSKAPIQSSRPADFAGDLTAARKGGPARTGDKALIEFLVKKVSLVTEEQAKQAHGKAQQDGVALDIAAVQLGFLTEDAMVNALTQECWVPHLKVDRYEIRKKALDTVSREDAVHYGVFPVDKLGSLLTLAMVNPLDAETIRTLESKTGLDIKKVVATRTEISQVIEKYYSGAVQAKEGSLNITQDIEPKSVTQMLAGVSAASDKLPPPKPSAQAPLPTPAPASIQPEIQDIDDLLTADEAIAPSIVEPISLKAEDIELVPEETSASAMRVGSVAEPSISEFELDDTSALTPNPAGATVAPEFEFEDAPAAKAPPKPLAPEFEDSPQPIHETGIVRPKPKPAPAPIPAAPAAPRPAAPAAQRPAAQAGTPGGKPATSRFTSKSQPAKPGLINLVPVMEEEFQHAITHGKSHVFEKWVGLQTRNRIINAVTVEPELEATLSGLFESARSA